MDFAGHGRDATLDWVTNNGSPTRPTGLFVQLHTGDPVLTGLDNIAANSERKSVTFGAASSGIAFSTNEVQWPSVPATETYSHVSIWDAATGGNCWYAYAMLAAVPVNAGGEFAFLVANLSLTHD